MSSSVGLKYTSVGCHAAAWPQGSDIEMVCAVSWHRHPVHVTVDQTVLHPSRSLHPSHLYWFYVCLPSPTADYRRLHNQRLHTCGCSKRAPVLRLCSLRQAAASVVEVWSSTWLASCLVSRSRDCPPCWWHMHRRARSASLCCCVLVCGFFPSCRHSTSAMSAATRTTHRIHNILSPVGLPPVPGYPSGTRVIFYYPTPKVRIPPSVQQCHTYLLTYYLTGTR